MSQPPLSICRPQDHTQQLTESIPKYLSLPSDPDVNIWSFYDFLEVHLLIFNATLIISIIVPLVDNTFDVQLYEIHGVPAVNTNLSRSLHIHLINLYPDIWWKTILLLPTQHGHHEMSHLQRTLLLPIRWPLPCTKQ